MLALWAVYHLHHPHRCRHHLPHLAKLQPVSLHHLRHQRLHFSEQMPGLLRLTFFSLRLAHLLLLIHFKRRLVHRIVLLLQPHQCFEVRFQALCSLLPRLPPQRLPTPPQLCFPQLPQSLPKSGHYLEQLLTAAVPLAEVDPSRLLTREAP